MSFILAVPIYRHFVVFYLWLIIYFLKFYNQKCCLGFTKVSVQFYSFLNLLMRKIKSEPGPAEVTIFSCQPKLLIQHTCHYHLYCRATYLTLLHTPWSRVLLEKLTGSAASQEIPRIFGTRRFITVLTSARHLSLS